MMSIEEKDRQYIWHPYTQMKSAPEIMPITKGEGVYVYDDKGNKYIDAISSWWVSIHGHANPYIAEKVYEQLKTLEHVIFAGYTHQPAVELAERLLNHLPENQRKLFFTDNGSTAVEVGMKMAFQYHYNQGHKKTKIIAFKDAYHGDTFGAMSVSGRSVFTAPFTPFLFDVIYIDVPVKGMEQEVLQEFVQLMDRDDIAAFVFEPLVCGAGGMKMYDAGILDKLVLYAKSAGVLTIADEVMTGFGRTGRVFASDHLTIKPDIICMSKGLTGGTLPMAITSCTETIYEAFLSDDKSKALFHGHSFTGSPVGCAAALASLDLVEQMEFYENIMRVEEKQKAFVEKMQQHELLENVRSCGTIFAADVKTEKGDGYLNDVKERIVDFFMDRNIIVRPLGNTFYILPPFIITDEELDVIYKTFEDFLKSLS